MGWSGIVLVLWEWSKLHCSVLAATFWWCSLEHRGEQHCSSRSWTGSDYCNAMITHAGQSTGSLGRALRLSFVSVVYKNVYIIIWLCITNATENAKQLRLPAACTSYCTSWPKILLSLAIIAKSHTPSASKMSWRWQNKIIIILMNCSHFWFSSYIRIASTYNYLYRFL